MKNQTLTFGVSGTLWEDNLVMIDMETKSQWSHLLGQAMKGPLTGQALDVIPSIITDWKSWRTAYPNSKVLLMPRTANAFVSKVMREKPGLQIGAVLGDVARAWDFFDLRNQLVINDKLGDKAILALYHKESGTAALYDRFVDNRTYTFALVKEKLIDQETHSQWDRLTGVAKAGPLKDKKLARVAGTISFGHIWAIFHPKSTRWRPEKSPPPDES